jgi:hypothetical protein
MDSMRSIYRAESKSLTDLLGKRLVARQTDSDVKGDRQFAIDNVWRNEDCNGPPDIIYVFKFTDRLANNSRVHNETWPPSFDSFVHRMAVETCPLYFQVDINSLSCCITWLDSSIVNSIGQEYKSAAYGFIESDLAGSIPASANGFNYCNIQSGTAGRFYGYEQVYIREGTCSSGLTCGSDGNVTINPSGYCSFVGGTAENFKISEASSQPTILKTVSSGTFTVQVIKITDAGLDLRWRGYIPDSLLNIVSDGPAEIAGGTISINSK